MLSYILKLSILYMKSVYNGMVVSYYLVSYLYRLRGCCYYSMKMKMKMGLERELSLCMLMLMLGLMSIMLSGNLDNFIALKYRAL